MNSKMQKRQFGRFTITLVWNEISATEYEIKLENDNIEDILVFSDSFDTNWIARFDIREQRSEIFKRSLNSFKVPEGVGSLTDL